jgi:hypothetical protein
MKKLWYQRPISVVSGIQQQAWILASDWGMAAARTFYRAPSESN